MGTLVIKIVAWMLWLLVKPASVAQCYFWIIWSVCWGVSLWWVERYFLAALCYATALGWVWMLNKAKERRQKQAEEERSAQTN